MIILNPLNECNAFTTTKKNNFYFGKFLMAQVFKAKS